MRNVRLVIVGACIAALAAAGGEAALELPRVSPNASVSQTIGTTEVTVRYCRPGVKGRVIWGELVPYGEVWRTGANEATRFVVTDDVTVNGEPLAAGSYALATIPGEEEWTVIFNKQAEQWGMYSYDAAQDALRIKVKPTAGAFVERMRFVFANLTDDSADVVLQWEKLQVAFTVRVDVVATTMARARKEVAAAAADDWRTPYRAAMFCLRHDIASDEVKGWIDKAVAVEQSYATVGAKARYLAATGHLAEAVAAAKKAIELGKAADSNTSSLEKLLSEWEAKQ